MDFKHLPSGSEDGTKLNLEALYKIAPSCFTEARDEKTGELRHVVDFKKLRELLGDETIEDYPEAYEFTWVGKQAAKREAASPINKTLRPVPDKSVDWDNTQNIYIEGDNLDALKLLQKAYVGKIKVIYFDPPYNTGNDFVYHDGFEKSQDEYDKESGIIDEFGNRYVKNTDSNGRFHSDWCTLIYSRATVARSILSDDGVIFVSIDDNEVENLKKILNEVFGESNFIASFIIVRSEGGGLAKRAVIGHDYLLAYAKDINVSKPLGRPKDIRGKIVNFNGEDYWIETDWFREEFGKYGTCHYEDILQFYNQSKKDEIDEGLKEGKYVLIPRDGKHIIGRYRKVADDTSKFYTINKHLNKNGVAELASIGMDKDFDYPKPTSLIKDFVLGATIHSKNAGDIIMDFFSGSATTADAVMQLNAEDGGNRKFILVQLPEQIDDKSQAHKDGFLTICDIGEERIRRAGKRIKEELKQKQPNLFANGNDGKQSLDTGFRVYRIDSSNMKEVYVAPKDLDPEQLDLFEDNVKEDRTELDLLYGCILDWGLKLSLPMTTEKVDGATVYTVNEGDLVACFGKPITDNIVKAMADKAPRRVVFRDSCFERDEQKINIFEQFKQQLGWSDDEALQNIRVI